VLQWAPSNSFFSSYASGMWTYRSVLLGRCDNIRTKSRLQQQTQRKLYPKLKRREELITCSFVLSINVSYRSFLKESNCTLMISSSNLLDDVRRLAEEAFMKHATWEQLSSIPPEAFCLLGSDSSDKDHFSRSTMNFNFLTCTEDVYTEMKL
jgi:hypothetical protein